MPCTPTGLLSQPYQRPLTPTHNVEYTTTISQPARTLVKQAMQPSGKMLSIPYISCTRKWCLGCCQTLQCVCVNAYRPRAANPAPAACPIGPEQPPATPERTCNISNITQRSRCKSSMHMYRRAGHTGYQYEAVHHRCQEWKVQCCSALAQKDPLDFAASSIHSQTRGPRGAFITAKLIHG